MKSIVRINVITSGLQVIIIGLVYFFLYKFLLKSLGVELLGVWSIVLSTSSLATLANFGIADSVVRYVALYSKEKDYGKIKQLVFTASIFLFSLFLIIALIILPIGHFILISVIPIKLLPQGLSLLPYSLACLVINSVTGVFASVLDGMQRNYIRNTIFSISSILLLIGGMALVPHFGLLGVAFAQVAQSIFSLLSCLFFVTHILKYNPFRKNWNKDIFKQIFSYGMRFQFVSLLALLNDPITKILLGKFGGMAFTGYYEMANRALMQVRGIVTSATQSLIPVMVQIEDDTYKRNAFYKKIFSNVLFFSISIIGVVVISSKIISLLWVGHIEPVFYNCTYLLGLSLFINMIIAPAYFNFMADGNLNALIRTHLILGVLNGAVGFILGYFFKGYGVIIAWLIAIITSSLYMLAYFNKLKGVSFQELLGRKELLFILICFLITGLPVCSIFLSPVSNFNQYIIWGGSLLFFNYIIFTFYIKYIRKNLV